MKVPTQEEYIKEHLGGALAASVLIGMVAAVVAFGGGLLVWESLFRATGLMIVSAVGMFLLSVVVFIAFVLPLAHKALVRKAKEKAKVDE